MVDLSIRYAHNYEGIDKFCYFLVFLIDIYFLENFQKDEIQLLYKYYIFKINHTIVDFQRYHHCYRQLFTSLV